MKTIRKFLPLIIIAALLATILACFAGCSIIYEKVSNIEELYAMKSNKSYKLTCDIDLKGREWTPLQVKNFDGDGHKISNFMLNKTGTYSKSGIDYKTGGFFLTINSISNVTFDNISGNMNVSGGDSDIGIICGRIWKKANNVKVSNATVTISVKGGSYNIGGFLGWDATNVGINDISIDNMELNIIYIDSSTGLNYIGGIAGDGHSITNCSVTNSKISCIEKSKSYRDFNIGGIVGDGYKVSNSFFSQGDILVEKDNAYGLTRVGGVVGYCSNGGTSYVQNSGCYDSNIDVAVSEGYTVGGVVGKTEGKIVDCLSSGNTIVCNTSSKSNEKYCGVAGLCSSSSGTTAKCIVYDCVINGTSSTVSKEMLANGFMSSVKGSINNCAVLETRVSGGYYDIFCPKSDVVFNCYISSNNYENINNIATIDSIEEILNVLSLDKSIWGVENNKPILK